MEYRHISAYIGTYQHIWHISAHIGILTELSKDMNLGYFHGFVQGGHDRNWGNCFWWGRGGAPPTLAVILMDDAGCGRSFHLPWITSRPISSPLTPSAWESILKLCGNPSLDRPLTNPSAFFRGHFSTQARPNPVNGVHFCRSLILSPFGQEFPLSIKIKSVTQFLQVQGRNFTRGWKRMN